MTQFNSMRRDFLRFGGHGMAAAAIAAVPLIAAAPQTGPHISVETMGVTLANVDNKTL